MATIVSQAKLPTTSVGSAYYRPYDAAGSPIAARSNASVVKIYDGANYGIYQVAIDVGVSTAGTVVWDDDDGNAAFEPFVIATATLSAGDIEDIAEAVAEAIGGGGLVGPGAGQVTFTITAGGDPVADADVWISSDADGQDVVAGTLQTDSEGKVLFLLDEGSTYYLWVQKDGVNSILGQAFVAEAD